MCRHSCFFSFLAPPEISLDWFFPSFFLTIFLLLLLPAFCHPSIFSFSSTLMGHSYFHFSHQNRFTLKQSLNRTTLSSLIYISKILLIASFGDQIYIHAKNTFQNCFILKNVFKISAYANRERSSDFPDDFQICDREEKQLIQQKSEDPSPSDLRVNG